MKPLNVLIRCVNMAGMAISVVGAINAGRTYRLLRDLASEAISTNRLGSDIAVEISALPVTIDLSIMAIFLGVLLMFTSDWLRKSKERVQAVNPSSSPPH